MIDRSGKTNGRLSRPGQLILCMIFLGLAGTLPAQDDILGDLKDESEQTQTTPAQDAAAADAAAAIAPDDASAPTADPSTGESDESATEAETTGGEQGVAEQAFH